MESQAEERTSPDGAQFSPRANLLVSGPVVIITRPAVFRDPASHAIVGLAPRVSAILGLGSSWLSKFLSKTVVTCVRI